MELFSLSFNAYKCNFGLCCKSSRTIDQAILHSKLHNSQGKYCCDLCLYTTNKLWSLKEHKLRHTDDLPFACTQCAHKARSKLDLARHIQRHSHTTSSKVKRGRPIKSTLVCQYDNCAYQAMNKLDLFDHVKSHINPLTRHNISKTKQPNMLQILLTVAIEDDIADIPRTDIVTAEIIESDTMEPKSIDVEHFDLVDSTELIQPIMVDDYNEEVDNRSAEDPDYVD